MHGELLSQLPADLLGLVPDGLVPAAPGPVALFGLVAVLGAASLGRRPGPEHGAVAAMLGEAAHAVRTPGAAYTAEVWEEGRAAGYAEGDQAGHARGYRQAMLDLAGQAGARPALRLVRAGDIA